MTYSQGNTITAADLNAYINQLNAIYGTGTGDRGYGQTTITMGTVAAGGTVLATDWTNLRNVAVVLANHQGTAQTLLPPGTEFASGATVKAEVPATTAYDLPTICTTLDTNRLTAASGSMTLTAGAFTATKSTTWGSGNATITGTFDIGFGSEDAARFFFNSGGQIRLTPNHPNGTSAQDIDWRSVFSKVGTITVAGKTVSNSGSLTTPTATTLGYYNLTTTAQTIYNGANIGGGAYAANDFTVTAQVANVTGANGGNGNTIRFVITIHDEHTGVSDTVATGMNVSFDHYRATTYLSGVVVPTYTTITAF